MLSLMLKLLTTTVIDSYRFVRPLKYLLLMEGWVKTLIEEN